MDPPSYEEASLQPPAPGFSNQPPASYSTSHPSTPPPSYGEAVTVPPNQFPVLTPPTVLAASTVTPQNNRLIVHPTAQIGVMQPFNSRQIPTAVPVVVTQPSPVPILVTCLTNIPGLVKCSHCHQVVITKVKHVPGSSAWCLCAIIALLGFVCGFCLIPLMIRNLQDAHHYCPMCGIHLHTYRR